MFLSDYFLHTVPWFFTETEKVLLAEQSCVIVLEELMKGQTENILKSHEEVLEKERKRKAGIIAERERLAEEERKAKERRRKEREEQRRIEELNKLHDQVDQVIIKRGIEKDEIIKQEISNVNGYFQGKEIVGVIGGLLTEMAMIFSAASEAIKGKEFLTEKNAYIFVVMYLGQWLKQEYFSLFLGPKLMQFLANKGTKADELHSADPAVINEFSDLYKAYEDEDAILKLIHHNAEAIGISKLAFDYLRASLFKLLLRKPTDPDPQGRNNAAKQRLKVVSIPEHFDKDPVNPQAIAKILIPKPHVESPEPQDNADPEEKSIDEAAKKQSLNKSKGAAGTSRKATTKIEGGEPEEDDKILTVKPLAEDLFVYVIHEAATKDVRNDLCEFMKKQFTKDLEAAGVMENIKENVDIVGGKIEATFFEAYKHIPTFNF